MIIALFFTLDNLVERYVSNYVIYIPKYLDRRCDLLVFAFDLQIQSQIGECTRLSTVISQEKFGKMLRDRMSWDSYAGFHANNE